MKALQGMEQLWSFRILLLALGMIFQMPTAKAQLPDWLTAKVDSVNAVVSKFGANPWDNGPDSIEVWNSRATDALWDLLNTPGIGQYPFEDSLTFRQETSADGRLTLISLFNNTGGSWYHCTNYLFYRKPDGSNVAMLLSAQGASPSGLDTLLIDNQVFYVWTEGTKTCNTCYTSSLCFFSAFDPDTLYVEELCNIQGRTDWGEDSDYLTYDPITQHVFFQSTHSDVSGWFFAEGLSLISLTTEEGDSSDPDLELGDVIRGEFSVRQALMEWGK